MEKITMDIAFTIGDSYSRHCCVAMASILYNNKDSRLRFHILSDHISAENKARLGALGNLGTEYEIIYHTVSPAAFEDFDILLGHITHHTYYRYIIADLLPDTAKCLYLDSDIVVNGPLKELWAVDVENYYCAGVEDIGIDDEYKNQAGLASYPYINAGMLLLNLRRIREDNMVPRLFEATGEILGKGLKYMDQDAINCVFKGKILILPAIWNYTKRDSAEMPELCSKAIVIHYTTGRKPWMPRHYSGHKMRRLYFKYLRMTPYRSDIHTFRKERLKYCIMKPFKSLFNTPKK